MAEKEISSAEAKRIRAKVAKQTKDRQRSKARRVVKERARYRVYDFKDFIRTYGVVGLAVGLVLGVQVKALVDQVVASFINPIVGIILPGTGALVDKSFALSIGSKEATFAYGAFISVMISFITVLLIVYFGIKALRLDKLDKK
ncbi:MAG TPA: MscL family protein [Candidatus Saccharimonadales bacterium]|nr:MscL family protein [Candidatus Saccharimonadales bacterium]